MRLSIKIFLLFLSGFLLNNSAGAQECKGRIRIISDIDNLRIFVNDSLEFKDRFEFEFEPGIYVLTITEDSDRWDAKSKTDTVNLDSCSLVEIVFPSSREILIDSDPQDARVYSSDSLIGYTPVILRHEINKVILRKDGFAEQEILLDERIAKVNVSLDFIGLEQKEDFIKKDVAKVLFGTMILFGATSAYFKIKADNNYDEYLRTGDVKFKNRTNDYDLISGISLGLTQLNIGFLVYKIFIDN